ncbi:nuclease domain-containing protein [Luteibacter yeojuensis]|uniref:DUF1364 domain-containing protein n=1 Tax=Luteibacter yeojuensis TaxID=345309 RepID=A0A7X5QTE1_9GAMM|nr:nuclease domain-containing protein [Luteibacter yeojuensis]NID14984.1 DUF1364 domain-containing protein [Luteibacter yeojuensis]
MTRPKTTPMRQEARGQRCTIRIPGCQGARDTVVLCHYRLDDTSGTATKPDDEQAAEGCHYCHDVVDGRLSPPAGYTYADVRLAHAEGVFRTQLRRRQVSPWDDAWKP